MRHKNIKKIIRETTVIFLLPLVFLFSLEGVLRIVQYGYPHTFFLKQRSNGTNWYVTNYQVAKRYFPKGLARRPFLPGRFSVSKDASTYRIFVLGESATMGDQLADFSFTFMLGELLRAHYPKTNFEVINTGITALSSWNILEFVKEMAQYQPDLFVVYCGNNEIVGPYGPGSVFSRLHSRALISFRIWTTSLKITQLLKNTLESIQQRLFNRQPLVWKSMEMFLQRQIASGDNRVRSATRHFQYNIREMVRMATHQGAKVMVCTVASNLRDAAPFASMHRSSLTKNEREAWGRLYREGIQLQEQGLFLQAIDFFHRAEQIDGDYAELNFRLASCYYQRKNYVKAKEYFIKAKNTDTLIFRPKSELNQVLVDDYEKKSGDAAIRLVDIEKICASVSLDTIPGANLFYDHVHFNIEGNFLVASSIFESMRANGWIPTAASVAPRQENNQLKIECLKRVGYTDIDHCTGLKNIIQLLSKPPFSHQLNYDVYMNDLKKQYQACAGFINKAAQQEAITTYEYALQLNPNNEAVRLRLAAAHMESGDFVLALEHYHYALRMDPRNDYIYFQLGMLYYKWRDFKKAAVHYRKSLFLWPGNAMAHNNLGVILEEQGRFSQAVASFVKALTIRPNLELARTNAERVRQKMKE